MKWGLRIGEIIQRVNKMGYTKKMYRHNTYYCHVSYKSDGVRQVELRADVLVPGFASRKLGQVPCEDVSVRFPIPDCWIYLFRVEKHFRYGSVKSAHRYSLY